MKGLLDESTVVERKSGFNWVKTLSAVGLLSLASVALRYSVDQYQKEEFINSRIQSFLSNPEIEPVRPPSFGSDSNSVFKILRDEEYKQKSLKRFTGAIQIETESFDDNPEPQDDLTPWVKFYKFHDYLNETFPLVHEHLALEKPNKINLLYTWKGSNPDLKPLLLTAHQDVVPVDALSASLWTYPPYSGHFDGKTIWGRGALDCKTLLIALLEGVETLIEDGFQPERTVVLAFGHDEESGGKGAAHINETLTERYGEDSFFALVDEGSAIEEIDGDWYATPSTGEKGHVIIQIKLTTPGGHSSVPPDHTSIGIAAKLITLLESDPFEPILSVNNPYFKLLQEVAKHSTNLTKGLKDDIFRAPYDQKAKQRLTEYISKDPKTRYLIQTSQAIDIIHGGVKSNALPEYVEIIYDSRISIDSNVNETVQHVLDHVREIADEFNLGLFYKNEPVKSTDSKGYFNITLDGSEIEALPTSPNHGEAWNVFAGTIKHVWGELVFDNKKPIYVSPSLVTGNTDTKKYYKLTPNIYRFFPTTTGVITDLGIHSIDEHITLDQHLQSVAFVYEFIQNVDRA